MNNSDNNPAPRVPLAMRVILGAASVACAACAGLYLYNVTMHRTDVAQGEAPGDAPGDFVAAPDVSSATTEFKDPEGVTFPSAPPVAAGIVRGVSTTAASGTVLADDSSSEEYCE